MFFKNRIAVTILLWSFLMVFPAVMPGTPVTFVISSHGSNTNTPTDGVFGSLNGGLFGPIIQTINPNSSWATISGVPWVSNAITGNPGDPGFIEYPNSTRLFVEHDFYIDPMFHILLATLKVMADDTAGGQANHQHIFEPNSTLTTHCSAVAPGCLVSTLYEGVITNLLTAGWNALGFEITQLGLSGFGLTYQATIVVEQNTPEPATYALIGLGLAGLGILRRRN